MPVSFTLPLFEEKPTSVKDMVFTVLTTEFPLSLIELLNIIKKRYHVSISFQAVRKAVLQLVEAKVLVKKGKKFSINREWILGLTKFGNILQKQYFAKPEAEGTTKIEVGPNVAVYTIPRLVDMDTIWRNIMQDNFASLKPCIPKVITFQAVHFWWVLVNLAQETELMKGLNKQGIKSYFVCYGNTPLDKWTAKYYNDLGISCKILSRPKDFINGHNIGVYGDLIIQATHPENTARKIEEFFKRYERIEDARLSELMEIVTEQINIKMTVIRDPMLTKTIRENVLSKF